MMCCGVGVLGSFDMFISTKGDLGFQDLRV